MSSLLNQRIQDALVGQIAWGVKRTHGSCIIFEFGNPNLLIKNKMQNANIVKRRVDIRGQWSFLIESDLWSGRLQSGEIASSDDSHEIIENLVDVINGQILEKLHIFDDYVEISFDLGAQIFIKKQDRDEKIIYIFDNENKCYFSVDNNFIMDIG